MLYLGVVRLEDKLEAYETSPCPITSERNNFQQAGNCFLWKWDETLLGKVPRKFQILKFSISVVGNWIKLTLNSKISKYNKNRLERFLKNNLLVKCQKIFDFGADLVCYCQQKLGSARKFG